ncbi:MAG: ABC transporter ATP-binding protein, partial [Acidimicrobiia bacterium]|nr:ABC transporter ATP-binding protein [Acidimicrobiia bacterium]
GSGKSTLCHALMGRSGYETGGSATVNGVSILDLETDARAAAGLFEAFQYPVEIPGVSFRDLVAEMAASSSEPDVVLSRADQAAEQLKMGPFLDRPVNVGLSGGEKKRAEMYQMAVAAPRVAILDEIDSGLDIDAVREVAGLVEELRGPDLGVLIITHYSRILRYMEPDKVHVMVDGRIVRSGGPEVADELEASGYEAERSGGGDPLADLP